MELFQLALDIQSKGVAEAQTALKGVEQSVIRTGQASVAQQKEIVTSTRLLGQMASVTDKFDRDAIRGLQELTRQQREWALSVGATAEQLVKITAIENRLSATAGSANNWANKFKGGLVSLTSQIAGTNPIVGQLAGTLGQFALGSALTGGILVGIAAIAFAYNQLTSSARAARKEIDDTAESLLRQAKSERAATVQGQREIFLSMERRMQDAQAALSRFSATGGAGPFGLGGKLQEKLLEGVKNASIEATQAAKNLKEAKEAEAKAHDKVSGALDRATPRTRSHAVATNDLAKAAKEAEAAQLRLAQAIADALIEQAKQRAANALNLGIPPIDIGDSTRGAGTRGRGEVPDFAQAKAAAEQALEDYKESVIQKMNNIGVSIRQGIAQTLGDAVYNGFAAAFNGEGLGGVFKAFGKTILAGVGSILTDLGKTWLEYGILMTTLGAALWNPFTSGPAAIAIGAALIALGGALGAVAHGGGGRGTAQAGAFREPSRTEDITRYKFIDRNGTMMTSGLNPKTPINVTIIGPNDPSAQRMITDLITKASRRAA